MSSSIPQAFKSLNITTAETKSDHENIYEVSYEYLSKIKNFNDVKSFNNCLVALINMDKYHKALDLLKQTPESVHQSAPLEKAYVYYKLGHTLQLQQLYKSLGSNISDIELRAIKHIVAQNAYQQGDVATSLELYHELITSNTKIDNELDLACNERAILSQIPHSQPRQQVLSSVVDEDNYDFLFNNSLIEISRGKLSKALKFLQLATDRCTASNMDSDPEDVAVELAPMKLTIAFIYQLQNKPQQALSILESTSLISVSDLMISLVVKNNTKSLVHHDAKVDDVNVIHRELNYSYNLHHLRQKLTKAQYQTVIRNHLLLSYQSGTLSATSQYLKSNALEEYLHDFPGDYTPFVYKVLITLQFTIDDMLNPVQSQAISRKLYKYVMHNLQGPAYKSENDSSSGQHKLIRDLTITATLLLTAINHSSSHYTQSFYALSSTHSTHFQATGKFIPSIVGTLIKIIPESHPRNASVELNKFYISFFEQLAQTSIADLVEDQDSYNMLKIIALNLRDVAELKEQVDDLVSKLKATAKAQDDQLLQTYFKPDATYADATAVLTPAEQLFSGSDIESLYATSIDSLRPSHHTSTASASKQARVTKPEPKQKKKKKNVKFSANKVLKPESEFNSDDLDQERWLPLKLRSYYKPSKKEKKKGAGGHQGAVEQGSTPQPASQPSAGASSATKSNANKKKKKKGKK